VQRALDAGFDAHVDKPVDFQHMREVIKAVISSAPLAGSLSEKKPRKG
jgi:DNA-binding response OmpR family regulator